MVWSMENSIEAGVERRLRTVLKVCTLELGLILGLSIAAAYLWLSPHVGTIEIAPSLIDPEVRRLAVEELVKQSPGIFDTFPDPQVGRVLTPKVSGRLPEGLQLESNSVGMREREYSLPKRSGEVRVVLLGDSFVFGQSCDQKDRCGVFLERHLRARSPGFSGDVSCLHLAMTSWDIIAECTYLRRQMSLLDPDLVIQVLVGNDLEDTATARGFGAIANFTFPWRENAFTLLGSIGRGDEGRGLLVAGVDFESRRRYQDAVTHLSRLSDAVEQVGGNYLALCTYWARIPCVAREQLLPGLRPEQVAYVTSAMSQDARFRVSEADSHWNRDGHQRIGKLLYALIQQRSLLPELPLTRWEEADSVLRELHEQGEAESKEQQSLKKRLRRASITRKLDFPQQGPAVCPQVHGGVDTQGNVSPYASILMPGGSVLKLSGRCYERVELDGVEVEVLVDEVEVHSFTLRTGQPLSLEVPIPEPLRGKEYLSIRFKADDYAYSGEGLRECVSFALACLEVVP